MAGDARYLRTNHQYQQYMPLNKQFTFAFNGELGWGKGLKDRPYPVFKNFYSGGLGSVRGFEQGTLGPVRPDRRVHRRHRATHPERELYLPVPGAGNDRTLRLFGFVDVGNVFGDRIRLHEPAARVRRRRPELDLPSGPAG